MSDQTQNTAGYGVTPEMIEAAFDKDFSKQLEATFGNDRPIRGSVIKGLVTAIERDYVTVDVGMKAEGRIPIQEFIEFGKDSADVKVGDEVDVFLDNIDNRRGEAQLSREKARREEVLDDLEKAFKDGESVPGIIFGKVKGGFMVDIGGILGFLPGSQLDARPITDLGPFMNVTLDFQLVKLDRQRNNIIVSRRSVVEQSSGNREELLADMHEGKEMKGVVKNITDYGAFVDLGGLDGLLHITDMAWYRIGHPSEVLKIGETIDVKVTRYDPENQRVSLGMKQLQSDPWKNVDDTYVIDSRVKGKITNITDYGAFVELAPGIEGLIHVSEMSWTRKNIHPGKIVSTSQEVEVLVLEVDHEKRRISLGLKQCQDNPWDLFAKEFKIGDEVEGTIRSMTDFGVFIGLNEEIDGLIHISDLSWDKSSEEALQDYKKGDTVKAKILALDPEKERIALGVKQLSSDPFTIVADAYKKGQIVTVKIIDTDNDGITVELDGVETYIKKRDLATDRAEQETSNFKAGDDLEVKIVALSGKDRKLVVSVKALQIAEEKQAVADYASDDDAGNSALAEALKSAGVSSKEEKKPAKKAAAKKPAAKKAAPKKAAKKDEEKKAK